jgi:hypothetical protein
MFDTEQSMDIPYGISWLQGRAGKMNSATVFIGLVFWGVLCGI